MHFVRIDPFLCKLPILYQYFSHKKLAYPNSLLFQKQRVGELPCAYETYAAHRAIPLFAISFPIKNIAEAVF